MSKFSDWFFNVSREDTGEEYVGYIENSRKSKKELRAELRNATGGVEEPSERASEGQKRSFYQRSRDKYQFTVEKADYSGSYDDEPDDEDSGIEDSREHDDGYGDAGEDEVNNQGWRLW